MRVQRPRQSKAARAKKLWGVVNAKRCTAMPSYVANFTRAPGIEGALLYQSVGEAYSAPTFGALMDVQKLSELKKICVF